MDLVSSIVDKRLTKRHDLTTPQGVRGRNSDNNRLNKVLGFQPSIFLEAGLDVAYKWIESELKKAGQILPQSKKALA